MGWDLSHARRLVPLFDAVYRLGNAASETYAIEPGVLPGRSIQTAYANQLVQVIWNQDVEKPLFANYWSGANGWYRVAYDPGNRTCRLGTPPFGLSSAFAQGGFIIWGVDSPMLASLGLSLYSATVSRPPADQAWLAKYYPEIASNGKKDHSSGLGMIRFLPFLVQASSRVHSRVEKRGLGL